MGTPFGNRPLPPKAFTSIDVQGASGSGGGTSTLKRKALRRYGRRGAIAR
jgi:hypothetical protein